jgi:hypothetical protein
MAITNKLKRPDLPGTIDNTAVKTASQGVADARQNLAGMNYDTYKQGAGYAGLKKSYEQQGQRAMQDTLGQMAARTGGMASSYAGSAAQQSYNNYMQSLEDAARAQFNDEYSKAKDNYNMALQDYQNAYDEYRDQYSDAWTRYNAENSAYETDRQYNKQVEDEAKQAEIDRVYNSAYYGEVPTFAEYQAAGGTLDEATYNSTVLEGSGKRTDEGRADVDTEYESIFGAEGFNWDEWLKEIDADGDGTPGEDEDLNAFFGKSSYGEDYWKQYAEDEAAGRADSDTQASQTSAANDITARIANGENLEDIAKEYQIGVDGKTWKSVTGKSQAQWQNVVNDNSIKNYTYSNDEKGATAIMSALMNSASTQLSAKDQANFDYIYGDGAYETVQRTLNYARNIRADDQGLFRDFDALYDDLTNRFPLFTNKQIMDLLYAANPEAYIVWAE